MTEADVRQTVIGDRNIVTGTGDVHIVYALPPAEAEERRSLLVLLERVSQFWITGVLEGSVHGAALLELNMARVSGAVEHPWERILELPGQDARPVPAKHSIEQLFDEASRAMLVLGAEGSGKTTVLLQLARALVARAERDPAQPVPVVLSLASWTGPRQELLAWVVEELKPDGAPPRSSSSWGSSSRLSLSPCRSGSTLPSLARSGTAHSTPASTPSSACCCGAGTPCPWDCRDCSTTERGWSSSSAPAAVIASSTDRSWNTSPGARMERGSAQKDPDRDRLLLR